MRSVRATALTVHWAPSVGVLPPYACVCVCCPKIPCIRQACSEYLSRRSCPAFYGLAVVRLWFKGAVRQCNDYTPATHRISTPLSGSLAKLSTSDSSLTVGGSAFPGSRRIRDHVQRVDTCHQPRSQASVSRQSGCASTLVPVARARYQKRGQDSAGSRGTLSMLVAVAKSGSPVGVGGARA